MTKTIAKPFLKWAGGKTQLISEIASVIPDKFKEGEFTYIEPFVGSGAILFWILNEYPNIERAVINDINKDLTDTYLTIKNHPEKLINILKVFEDEYHAISEELELKKEYYYKKRSEFNARKEDIITHSAIFIFLNRTCFNGLYRVNRKNEFNVPIGSYKKPTICDAGNILAVSKALQKVEILNSDFEDTLKHAEGNTLFYFDPPYKPLSETSSFNSYTKDEFNDNEQIRLKDFCKQIDLFGYDWILSNSDVKGKDPNDMFFDDLYSDFKIERVEATRMINANPDKRGKLNELLITNSKYITQNVEEL